MPYGISLRCKNCGSKPWKNNGLIFDCGSEIPKYDFTKSPWWRFWNRGDCWTPKNNSKFSEECEQRAFAKKVQKVIKDSLNS